MSDVLILSETITISDNEEFVESESQPVSRNPSRIHQTSVELMESPVQPDLPRNSFRMQRKPPSRSRRPRIHPWTPGYNSYRRSMQMYRHKEGIAVLCLRTHCFCITNGQTSYVREDDPNVDQALMDIVSSMTITMLLLTDEVSRLQWEVLMKKCEKQNTLWKIPIVTLPVNEDFCRICKRDCIRWKAIAGLNKLRKFSVEQIPHN